MQIRSRWLRVAGALAALAFVAGCGDDPTCPCETGPWADVVLPDLGGVGLVGVAARGSRVVAIGAGMTPGSGAVVQTTGGPWEMLPLPTSPSGAVFIGVALDPAAKTILVGGTAAAEPLVLEEAAPWQATTLPATGYLNAVTTGGNDSVLAVGTASGGLAATRTAPGNWITDRAGFTTPQEKGLADVSYSEGVFAACGWDDNTLQPIVRMHDGTGWKDVSGPAVVLPPEFRIEHRAVCLEPNGALLVGGAIVESTGAQDRYTARLLRRTSAGEWIEIVLPDATVVESVNDILWASDGNVYLACGETTARVLRWDGLRWSDEGPAVRGRMLSLAEDAAGHVYAAGFRKDGTTQPLLRVRTPLGTPSLLSDLACASPWKVKF